MNKIRKEAREKVFTSENENDDNLLEGLYLLFVYWYLPAYHPIVEMQRVGAIA